MSQPKVGKAKFGGDFVKRKYWKLKDGESTFRILPPIGDSACESGRWSHFYNVHYGYKNSQGQMRVFQSPLVKNRKTKMVEVPDAALERIEALKAKQSEAKSKGDDTASKRIGDLLQQYNLDNNHYVNAIDEQGNIGILKLRHRAKLALDATIKSLRDAGVDPLDSETGRFFVFRRSGNGLETTFQVGIKQRDLNVQGVGQVKQDIVHVLDDSILNRLGREAADLEKLYKRPTAEEVARIVKESDLQTGRSRAVDEILDAKKDDNAIEGDEPEEETTTATTTVQTTASAPAAAQTAPTPATTPVQAAPAPQAAPAQAPVTSKSFTSSAPPKTTAQAITEQSDEDFLKSLGV
jgi:hypothetical protein